MKKKFLVLLGIFALVTFFIFWGNKPKKGKISVKKTGETAVISKAEVQYQNDYLSFNYTDDYEKRSEDNSLWLVGKRGIPESLTLVCRDFESNLDEDSGIQMRRIKKEEYTESELDVDGVWGRYFERKDLSERTVFLLKDGVMCTLSMTANSNDKNLGEKFQKIVDSWQWKSQ